MSTLMFPHKSDRYRLLRIIFSCAQGEKSQEELERRCKVTQPTISKLINLHEGSPGVSRVSIIKLLLHGFRLEPRDIDALLWLYDGQPLSEAEVQIYFNKRNPRVFAQSEGELRSRIMKLAARVIDPRKPLHEARVKIVFNLREDSLLEEMEEQLRLEKEPGQRLVVTKYPSSLTNSFEGIRDSSHIFPLIKSQSARHRAQRLYQERWENFRDHINSFGERSIHAKQDLKNYLVNGSAEIAASSERRRHIEHWIKLLEECPHYQVALTDTSPEFEVGVKNGVVAVVRGIPYGKGEKTSVWGVHRFYWYDDTSILWFFLQFEHWWDEISSSDRSKSNVIEYLHKLLAGC
jgi:hypothetical protein